MRNDIREAVHMAKRNGVKINYAAFARQYDCDYRIFRKYYNERDDTVINSRKPRKVTKKIDGFEEIIKEKSLKFNAPAIAIYNLLKNEYGYTGSYSTIKAYIQTLKKDKMK